MKIGVLFGMLFCMIAVTQAQQTIREGVFTVGEIKYKVSELISNKERLIWRTQRPKLPENPEYAEKDGGRFYLIDAFVRLSNPQDFDQIVRNTLGAAKVQALKNVGEELSLNFYLTPAGEILDLYFVVKSGTLLTLEDISAVDLALREQYTATFKAEDEYNWYTYLNYISTGGAVKF